MTQKKSEVQTKKRSDKPPPFAPTPLPTTIKNKLDHCINEDNGEWTKIITDFDEQNEGKAFCWKTVIGEEDENIIPNNNPNASDNNNEKKRCPFRTTEEFLAYFPTWFMLSVIIFVAVAIGNWLNGTPFKNQLY
eukprot:c13716_g1_i1.p1 GENE.c13716_g1_i1~~c13716_g1_i1.p1  ORF type:complete len:134 (-),score=51.66 c13716_g1_i1:21-422(-)